MNQQLEKIIKYAIRFIDIDCAKSFIEGAKKCMVILQGDDGYYWITSFADAQVLYKNGFKIIK